MDDTVKLLLRVIAVGFGTVGTFMFLFWFWAGFAWSFANVTTFESGEQAVAMFFLSIISIVISGVSAALVRGEGR